MDYSSEASSNLYCPSQGYGARMVMVPTLRKQRGLYTNSCPQSDVSYSISNPHTPYNIPRNNISQNEESAIPLNTETPSYLKSGSLPKNITRLDLELVHSLPVKEEPNKRSDGPIDLSSSNSGGGNRNESPLNDVDDSGDNNGSLANDYEKPEEMLLKSPKKEPESPVTTSSSPSCDSFPMDEEEPLKRRGRKRKISTAEEQFLGFSNDQLPSTSSINSDVGLESKSSQTSVASSTRTSVSNGGIPRQAGSKREEVLRAARSLFSKRTRTLYHWLYPATSKARLKAIVAAAWDTLSSAEKDFYVSQVLGRFGVPAGSLMVNPQLGGFRNSGSVLKGTVVIGGSGSGANETHRAVSDLLISESDVEWAPYSRSVTGTPTTAGRKRRRQNSRGGYSDVGVSGSSDVDTDATIDDEETRILQQIREETLCEDFADDPELCHEFEQFRWALHVTNAELASSRK